MGKKLNKKDLLSTNLATKKGYCTQRIKEKAVKITEGYKNPFTGDLMDSRTYVHFRTFAIALEECETFNSFDELLKSKLK